MEAPIVMVVRAFTAEKFDGTGNREIRYTLRRMGGRQNIFDEIFIADEIEQSSSFTRADILGIFTAFVREVRKLLVQGHRVRIAGLGTFFVSINVNSYLTPEELSTRSIHTITPRFSPARELHLVNDALAETRSQNNVQFQIRRFDNDTELPENGDNGEPENGEGEGEIIDPEA